MQEAKPAERKPNKEILEHEKKRQVELKLLQLRDAMEERGYNEEEIDERIDQARQKLLAQMAKETQDTEVKK